MIRYLFFFILFPILLSAKSLSCKFEEVYPSGEIQTGKIYIQDSKMRYQYQSQDLYTLIYKTDSLYFIRNREPDKFEKITKNKELFAKIMRIYKNFPNIELDQQFDDLSISIELNKKQELIKRMAILSKDLSLSIYLIDCDENIIPKNYFDHNPFYEVTF